MGRTPAVIIIARHGARLDAEDPDWLANSSTPYDPPLSYGGWTQTRALGGRIASLLHERDAALNEADEDAALCGAEDVAANIASSGSNTNVKRRKHRVIIHSSPFLRCIQSSIAISAGMAQYKGNLAKFEARAAHSKNPRSSRLFTPSRSQTVDATIFETKFGIGPGNPKAADDSHKKAAERVGDTEFMKPTLRVDACLGEWLSPDYFEFITAPPSSNMMVAGAKADLLRCGTPLRGPGMAVEPPSDPPPLDLDGRSVTEALDRVSISDKPKASPDNHASAKGPLNDGASSSKTVPGSRHKSVSKGYVPPIPDYAIRTTAPIPPGFVAHARDACVKVDFQWDSMRKPQNWGDGGEHGEEWSSMHKRFRRGLMGMITWYKVHGPFHDPQAEEADAVQDDQMDDGEDIVLVLVTHGAGCNALIGALTNQPVLLDIGMASLTMAIHKGPSYTQSSDAFSRGSPTARRKSSVDCSQSEEYSMRYVASMDHLRAGVDPLKIPQLMSPRYAPIAEQSSRRSSASAASTGSPQAEPADRGKNSALGSVRRSRATTASGSGTWSKDHILPSPMHTGLWGSFSTANRVDSLPEASERAEAGLTEDEGEEEPSPVQPQGNPGQRSATVASAPPPARSASTKGLWGSGPNRPPARRWTLIQQN